MRHRDRQARNRARKLWKIRVKGMLALCAGAVSFLAGIWLLVAGLPQAMAEEHDFKAATPCPASVVASRADCLRAAWFTVDEVRISKGRGSSYSAQLSGPADWSGRIDFDGEKPLLRRLHPGDRVAGTVWRGDIVAVFALGTGQRTSAHPVGGPLYAAGFGVALIMAGGQGLFAARWWLKRPEECLNRTPAPLTAAGWSALGLGCYAIVLTFWLLSFDAQVWLLLVSWLVAAMPLCCVLFYGFTRSPRPQ
ncbi:hypothetical protein AB0F96_05550 [Streptomyces sp. NPDC023998]|uniref:hypothetical protein n=1 Tax=Streptomyces sp. NPDC023998 TaxID=3154597 RepID=UPI0033CCA945